MLNPDMQIQTKSIPVTFTAHIQYCFDCMNLRMKAK